MVVRNANTRGVPEPSKAELASIKYILLRKGLGKGRTVRKQVTTRFYRKHVVAIRWVSRNLTHNGVRLVPVSAVLIRAYYSVELGQLEKFIRALQSGFIDEKEQASVVRLRRFLFSRERTTGPSGSERDEIYEKTAVALKHYLNGKSIAHLYSTQAEGKEFFELPEEKQGKKSKKEEKCAKDEKKVPKRVKPEQSE